MRSLSTSPAYASSVPDMAYGSRRLIAHLALYLYAKFPLCVLSFVDQPCTSIPRLSTGLRTRNPSQYRASA
eukprot:1535914-Rhodomonas_salina.6